MSLGLGRRNGVCLVEMLIMRESEDQCKQGIAGPCVPVLAENRPDLPRRCPVIVTRARAIYGSRALAAR